MASDDDTIWVEVRARADEASFDQVEHTLRDKLKGAAEGVTDGFRDLEGKLKDRFEGLGDGVKDVLKDVFSHELPKEFDTEGIGDKLGSSIGDKIGSALGNSLPKELSSILGGTFDNIAKDLGGKLGSAIGSGVNDLGKSFGVDLGGIADTVGDITDKVRGITDAYHSAHDAITSTTSGLTDAAAGFAAGSKGEAILGRLGGLAEPLGVATGVSGAFDAADSWVQQIQSAHPGAAPVTGPLSEYLGSFAAPFREMKEGWDWLTKPQAPEESSTDKLYKGVFGGGGGTTSAEEVEVQSQIADVSAGTVTLGGNISLPAGLASGGGSRGSEALSTAVGNSGGASESALSGITGDSGSSLGSSGSFSGLGFSQGGDVNGPGPIGQDSVLAMLAPGERVLTPDQNEAWKSMLHFAGGGNVPEAPAEPAPSSSGDTNDTIGGAGAEDAGGGSDQGSDGGAPGTVGGTQAPGAVQAASDQAQDAIGQPGQNVVDPAQRGIAGGTKTSKGIQEQSYGYGKGFQVTGQGLIGFAESAPGAIAQAAASGASGGPAPAGIAAGAGAAALTSLWNTIGQPEMNEAITEGVKIGADLLSAPEQELAVGGENFENWSQKLIGGEIGNVTNLINTAANTQAPLTPQQGTGTLGQAAQPGGQQGTLGGQPSPQGTPNDPMHVSIVGGQSGSAQNSQMSYVGMDSSQPLPG